MPNLIVINHHDIRIKEYNGKRVVTFKEIDELHGKSENSARKRFNNNKKHFILGEDYFVLKRVEAEELGYTAPNGMVLITESGYLMVAKAFEDDLSWKVQKQLVNSYFRLQEVKTMVQQFYIPQSMSEALRLAADLEDARAKLEQENRILLPKAESFETFLNASGNLTIEETAKTLNIKGVGRNKLFDILVSLEILMRKGFGDFRYYESYQKYVESGYFIHKQNPFRKGLEIIKRTQVFVTPKGLDWIYKKLKQNGYIKATA